MRQNLYVVIFHFVVTFRFLVFGQSMAILVWKKSVLFSFYMLHAK